MEQKLSDRKHQLALFSSRLHGQSPLKKLSKGFGFVTDQDGSGVQSALDVEPGEKITVQLADGRIDARVLERFTEEFPAQDR